MEFCGISLTSTETVAIVGVALTVASELIAASPLKDNSIAQIAMTVLKGYTRRIGAADTPRVSDQTAAPVQIQQGSPDKASPAPRRRGRPPGSKNVSRSGSKKA